MEKAEDIPKPEISEIESPDRKSSFDSVTREAIGGQSVEDLPPNYFKSPQYIGSFISFALSFQGAFLGYVMPANALTIINNDLGPSADIIWVLLVFVLIQTITYGLVGRLSDIFGRRWYFIGGNTLAAVGFLICGRASSINMLIGGSAVAGIGTAVQQSIPVISGELVPNRHRFLALGILFAIFSPLSTIAPGIGRAMTDNEHGWRWIYYLVTMTSGIAAVLQVLCFHPPTFSLLHKRSSKTDALKGLDYGGLVIFTGSSASLLLGLSWGGQKYDWNSYQVITTIVVGGVGLIAFGLYENYAGIKHPLVPLYLFKNRNYVCMVIISSVGSMLFYAISIVWPSQISLLYSASNDQTGWISCTLTAGAVFGQFCGMFSSFVPNVKWQLVASTVVFTTFAGGMAAATSDNKGLGIAFTLLTAIPIGFMEVLTIGGGPMTVDPKDIGLANGVQYVIRSGMSSLAVSVYVTILNNKVASNLAYYVPTAAITAGLPSTSIPSLFAAIASGDATAFATVPGISPAILGAVNVALQIAYNKAFQVIYLVSLAFGFCAVIAALCINSTKLDEKMTTEIARKLQGLVRKKDVESE